MLTPASASARDRRAIPPGLSSTSVTSDSPSMYVYALVVEDGLGGLVVSGRHDHVSRVADAPATDRPQVDATGRERLGERRHRAGLVLQLDDELVGHRVGLLRGGWVTDSIRLCYGPGHGRPTLPIAASEALDIPAAGGRVAVDAAGIRWSAISWGDPAARPLLLIHGVTSSAATWWRVGPALAASGRRVVAVDLPGHGRTGQWLGHHRFRDNAADVAACIRAAGLETPDLQVVGHSWGAMTAAALPAAGLRPADTRAAGSSGGAGDYIFAMASDPDERTYDDLDEAALQSGAPIRPGRTAT